MSNLDLALWGGAECTINRIGDRYSDQSVLSGHDKRLDDLDRFAALGIKALRYPLLWESFAAVTDPERLWAWHDARLDRLRTFGIQPILGLVHHGSGPPVTHLLSSDFPAGLREHAALAARRYPWVRDWTPVNEPLTTARFSALYGLWYPHLRDESAFWCALLTQIEGVRLAMKEIRQVHHGARLIQTEDLGHTAATPERQGQADHDNLRRWASWDMLAGKFTSDHPLWPRLAGMKLECQLERNAAEPSIPDVLGINHYLTSDRFLDHRLGLYPSTAHGESASGPLADCEAIRVCAEPPGLEGALRACWDRYRLPMAVTEAHNGCTREEQMRWLVETWSVASRLRQEGLPIEAVTVWSLLGAHDWDSLLTRSDGRYESGVFDVRSDPPRATALAPLVRGLATGCVPDHPVLCNTGWWRHHRPSMPIVKESVAHVARRPLLIAGATGTLGQAFAGACRLRGIDHVLTGRDSLDLTNVASMTNTLDELQPWAVVNAAGWVRVDEAERSADACLAANHTGAVALGEACARRHIHYTCFSSDLVFDGLADRAYVESDAKGPLSVYGVSKARTDDVLMRAPARALIVRTAAFFSPYDRQNFAVHLAAALKEERPFYAVADCMTSPTYVPDLVRATLDLIIDDETGLWHLANEGATTWANFAYKLAEALALPTETLKPRAMARMGWTATRPRSSALTSERGLIMPSLESAIERFSNELG